MAVCRRQQTIGSSMALGGGINTCQHLYQYPPGARNKPCDDQLLVTSSLCRSCCALLHHHASHGTANYVVTDHFLGGLFLANIFLML